MVQARLNNLSIDSLSRKNRIVAQYLFENPGEARELTSAAIARKLNIAQSTVSRFATYILGYASFRDMQMDIYPDIATEELSEIYDGDDIDNIKKKLMRQYRNMAALTDELNGEKQIEKTIKLLTNADHITCFGLGNSGLFANYLNNRLCQLGLRSSFINTVEGLKGTLTTSTEKDVLIMMSETGATPDVIAGAKVSKYFNVPIVCFTRANDNQLSKMSDICLYTFNGSYNFGMDYISMRCSQLYLIDIIFFSIISTNTMYHKKLLFASKKI